MHATNTVVVGSLESLARTSLAATGNLYVPVEEVEAKLRYRSEAVPAHVQPTAAGFRLELAQPVYGVAAGQAAVLYEDGVVVGAGIIEADP